MKDDINRSETGSVTRHYIYLNRQKGLKGSKAR